MSLKSNVQSVCEQSARSFAMDPAAVAKAMIAEASRSYKRILRGQDAEPENVFDSTLRAVLCDADAETAPKAGKNGKGKTPAETAPTA